MDRWHGPRRGRPEPLDCASLILILGLPADVIGRKPWLEALKYLSNLPLAKRSSGAMNLSTPQNNYIHLYSISCGVMIIDNIEFVLQGMEYLCISLNGGRNVFCRS